MQKKNNQKLIKRTKFRLGRIWTNVTRTNNPTRAFNFRRDREMPKKNASNTKIDQYHLTQNTFIYNVSGQMTSEFYEWRLVQNEFVTIFWMSRFEGKFGMNNKQTKTALFFMDFQIMSWIVLPNCSNTKYYRTTVLLTITQIYKFLIETFWALADNTLKWCRTMCVLKLKPWGIENALFSYWSLVLFENYQSNSNSLDPENILF